MPKRADESVNAVKPHCRELSNRKPACHPESGSGFTRLDEHAAIISL